MRLFLSPHTLDELFGMPHEILRVQPGYWTIDPDEYKTALVERWGEDIVFRESIAHFPLSWYLTASGGASFSLGANSVSFDVYDTFEDFVLWHRSIIPEERHRLYLCGEEVFGNLEIRSETSREKIRRFAGVKWANFTPNPIAPFPR
jgi:hypothetical protein